MENDLKGNVNCFELAGGSSYRGFELPGFDCKVNPRFTDTRLIRTPHNYGQFSLSLGKESPHIFSKFNPLNTRDSPLIRTLSIAPSVSLLTGYAHPVNKDTEGAIE